MYWTFLVITACVLGLFGAVCYADDPKQSRVAAATDSAVRLLLGDVEAQHITPQVTVKDLLDKTHTADELVGVLSGAQQIGGPRWLDDQTCQVRLEIPADAVARDLEHIAATHEKTSPVSTDDVRRLARAWGDETFSATGTSTRASLESVRPPRSAAETWQVISDQGVRQSLIAARQQAINRVIDSLKPIHLTPGETFGDAFAKSPALADRLSKWLGERPVTLVDFRDDGQVEVTLCASPGEIYDYLRVALRDQKDVPQPANDRDWTSLREEITEKVAAPVGLGAAPEQQPPATQMMAVMLKSPPSWVDGQIDVTGSGSGSNNLLKNARVAQQHAMGKLRRQVFALPWADGKNLGEVSQGDRRLSDVVEQAIKQDARLYSTEYESDGSATVRISLDLRDLWQQIDPRP